MSKQNITFSDSKEESVLVPMTTEDFIRVAEELKAVREELREAELELEKIKLQKKNAEENIVEVEGLREGILNQITSQKCYKKLYCSWEMNWDTGIKTKRAMTEYGSIVIEETEITDQDRQLAIPTETSEEEDIEKAMEAVAEMEAQ